ncbi:MAG: AbrB/MazE/SpoVT family DNA-binding domain-containing protein [Acidilobaceae archaeon]
MSGREFVRRVQLLGRFTYAVTLPKEWVRAHGLTRGSKVFIDVLPDGSLRIKATPLLSEHYASKQVELFSGEELDQVFFETLASLIAGYDFVLISFNELTSGYTESLLEKLSKSIPGVELIKGELDAKVMLAREKEREKDPRALESSLNLALKLLTDTLRNPDKLELAEIAFNNARRMLMENEIHKRLGSTLGGRVVSSLDIHCVTVALQIMKNIVFVYRAVKHFSEGLKIDDMDISELLRDLENKLESFFWLSLRLFREPSWEAYRDIVKLYLEIVRRTSVLRVSEHARILIDILNRSLTDLVIELGVYVSALGVVMARLGG